MIDGPGLQNRLHVPEDLLHLPEFLVLEGRLFGAELSVGPEDPLAAALRQSSLD